jgi:hypothetical protein
MNDGMSDRRRFIVQAGRAAAGSVLGAGFIGRAVAGEHEHGGAMGRGGADGYVMDSTVTKHCATCEFWGGPRRLSQDRKIARSQDRKIARSQDRKSITITGLGWCNNPESLNYQKLTSPEHGPMDAWNKWQLLG